MKNTLNGVLLVFAVVLGFMNVVQWIQLRHRAERLAQVEARLASAVEAGAAADHRVASAERRAKILTDILRDTSATAAEGTQQVTQLEEPLAAAQDTAAANGPAAMLRDPEMKELIKSQQSVAVTSMIQKQYEPLIQQTRLTRDQANTLKDLLTKKNLAISEIGASVIDPAADDAKRADGYRRIKAEKEGYDGQIKQLIGDDNYRAFQDEKTVPDRAVVGRFRDQVAGRPTALSAEQERQLIQAISEERTSFRYTASSSNGQNRTEQLARDQQQLQDQVLARARQFLNPEQVAAFEQFQKAQDEMRINMMKMAAKMMPRKGPSSP
jgi:hypothetical protein